MAVATLTFGDRVAAEVERKRSQLVVGLDPRPDLLPVELRGDVTRFCCGIVDAVAPHAVAVKPQLAFFEALGPAGMGAFVETCAYARRAGLLVIADGKRGDIGSTARAYAAAYLEGEDAGRRRAHGQPVARARLGRAVPLRGTPLRHRDLLRREDVERGRRRAGHDALRRPARPGRRVAALVADWGADLVGEHGLSAVGAVVGATHPRAVSEARKLMPQTILLLPGVGAQGASPGDLARAFTSGPASALVNASRSVNYAFRDSRRRLPCCGRRRGGAAARTRYGPSRAGSRPRRPRWRAYAGPGGAASRRRRSRSAPARRAPQRRPATPRRHARADRHAARSRRPTASPLYVVRAGDTIEAISTRTGVPQARILALNPKVSPTALFIGEKLRLS